MGQGNTKYFYTSLYVLKIKPLAVLYAFHF